MEIDKLITDESGQLFTYKEAVETAYLLSKQYKKQLSVIKEGENFSIIGARYADLHRFELHIIFTTVVENGNDRRRT
jgi:hypothetical protein